MPANKNQVARIVRIVADLRSQSHDHLTTGEIVRHLKDDATNPINCSQRTIARDIAFLREEFKAPIMWDANRKVYYLKDKNWIFEYSVLSEELMASTILGARLAQDIMPEPLKSEIQSAVNHHLNSNNAETLEGTFIDSLLIATGLKATIEPETFKAVFDAWRQRQSIEFVYQKNRETASTRLFEPHIVTLQNGLWYTKGVCLPGGERRVFDIHRMSNVKLTGKIFEIDKTILEDIRNNGLFSFPKLNGVKIHCDKSIAFYLREHQEAKKLEVVDQPDGSVIVTLPPAVAHDVIRWVLGEAGKIRILEPSSLREELVANARKVVERNT